MTIYVLDAAALFSQWTLQNPDSSLLTTPSVLNELVNRPSQERAQRLISTDRLRVEAPGPKHVKAVKKAAEHTGDLGVLSKVDTELIALALQEKERNKRVTVVSTDLSVLNTAALLGISILDPGKRMKHLVRWRLKCPACDHEEDFVAVRMECPVCGTEMKRKAGDKRNMR
ncbi:MAG: NOB1 family endonuclease [Candidatus Hermodarchaeota archaeon]